MKNKLTPASDALAEEFDSYFYKKYGKGVRRTAFLAIVFVCYMRLPFEKVHVRASSLFDRFEDAYNNAEGLDRETPAWKYALAYADRRVGK